MFIIQACNDQIALHDITDITQSNRYFLLFLNTELVK